MKRTLIATIAATAAILAAAGCGVFDSVHDAVQQLVGYGKTVLPDPEAAKKYRAQYARYRSLYPAIQNL